MITLMFLRCLFSKDGEERWFAYFTVIVLVGTGLIVFVVPIMLAEFLVCLPFMLIYWRIHKEPQPAQPPTRKHIIAEAKKRLAEDLSFSHTFRDRDERESFVAGAHARYRQRLGQIAEQE